MAQITISVNTILLNNPAIYCDILEIAEDVELWVQKALAETPGALSPYIVTTDYQDCRYNIRVKIEDQPDSFFEGLQELISSDDSILQGYVGCNNYNGLLRLKGWAEQHRYESVATTVIIKKSAALIRGVSARRITDRMQAELRERQIITTVHTREYTNYYKIKIYNSGDYSVRINSIVTRLFPARCSEWGSHIILVNDSRELLHFNSLQEDLYTCEFQLDPNETVATFLVPTDSQKKVGEQIHKIFSKSIIDKNKKPNNNNINKMEETK